MSRIPAGGGIRSHAPRALLLGFVHESYEVARVQRGAERVHAEEVHAHDLLRRQPRVRLLCVAAVDDVRVPVAHVVVEEDGVHVWVGGVHEEGLAVVRARAGPRVLPPQGVVVSQRQRAALPRRSRELGRHGGVARHHVRALDAVVVRHPALRVHVPQALLLPGPAPRAEHHARLPGQLSVPHAGLPHAEPLVPAGAVLVERVRVARVRVDLGRGPANVARRAEAAQLQCHPAPPRAE
mmetsp:Transcript_19699/g.67061  ORF Transcript_19699/g.67061 Transcript_19699/m.67061 type:complete len:238 (+) Transcript_19699:887-1600(+)